MNAALVSLRRVMLLPGWALANLVVGAAVPATTPIEGLREATPRVHALVGGRVVVSPTEILDHATVVVRDGLIAAVGVDLAVPPDARVWDVRGRTVYAGFIESDSSLFLPAAWKSGAAVRRTEEGEAPAPATGTPPGVPEPPTGARAWNPRVTPERLAHRALTADSRGAEAMRRLGFAVVHVVPARGVFRGQSALVSLGRGNFNTTVVRETVGQALALEHGGGGPVSTYPVSLMGAMALQRQTLLDALWYADVQARHREAGGERPEANAALAALGPVVRGEQPVYFELESELDLARAARIAAEFKLKLVLRGSGYDYRVLRELPRGVPVVVPLAFPEPPEVENPEHAIDIPLDRLEHWELAPANPARLAAAQVPVALTTAGLRRPESEFWSRVRLAVQRGLPAATALAALTTTPADFLGIGRTHGTVAAGKAANLVVAGGDLFRAEEGEVQLVWVDGEPFPLDAWHRFDARGTWRVAWTGAPDQAPAEIKIAGRSASRLRANAGGADVTVRAAGSGFTLAAPARWFGLELGTVRLVARAEGAALVGSGEWPDGRPLHWRAERTAGPAAPKPTVRKTTVAVAPAGVYPAGAYGRAGLPAQPPAVLVRNATLWTSGPAGVVTGGDLLIEAGRIARVGRGLAAPAGAIVIDGTGKHVSPGLIDCHSHVAIDRGVNEGTHSVTVEVRVGDALDPTDIGLYRQLAGGLTTSNLLHGSANAMGGQNQVIKLRWGGTAEELKFAAAPPGVKFALGENVTRKNATTLATRYPVSRMGVREIMLDAFSRARDYRREWAEFRAGQSARPPRRDLRLEAALEILEGKRLIHIHSYRQDEVLAFIRLAQELKLPVATFQHILDGYKVAREIAALGAGGSAFSDWWGYKHEVIDAIPYAGALLHEAGVLVSFNSDDRELARHLNTEAAKAVKYGGVPPIEALKFVTINPARQLRIDDRVGSLEPGKDADFVLWSAPPLSGYARVEQAWIDGRRYFDREEDARQRAAAETARAALVQKILPERLRTLGTGGTSGGSGGPAGGDQGPARPTVLTILQELAGAHDGAQRGLYHNGTDAHNCTTHDQP